VERTIKSNCSSVAAEKELISFSTPFAKILIPNSFSG